MWKLIYKNLWARRRRNGWLLAELILVTVLCWTMFDPAVVVLHDMLEPANFDPDRLCMVDLAEYQPGSPHYREEDMDSAALVNAYLQLVDKVTTLDEVERACPIFGFLYPGSQGNGYTMLYAANDTVPVKTMWMQFIPHTGYFETFGFRPGIGRTPEELSDYDYKEGDSVITEDAAEALFGTKDVRNRRLRDVTDTDSTLTNPIIGTVGAFKTYAAWRPVPIVFWAVQEYDLSLFESSAHILVRLREGVDAKAFVKKFEPWMAKEMKRGNLFARRLYTYDSVIEGRLAMASMPTVRRSTLTSVFFLVNLCLGVIGTFWLQTRSRREEVGVLLSFGGTPSTVMRVLMGEGIVLTLVAAAIGHAIYLVYAHGEGLAQPINRWITSVQDCWLDHFGTHALGVGVIITVVLLVVVCIGVFIPARAASRVNPVEALRDE